MTQKTVFRNCLGILLPDGSSPEGLDVLVEGNRIKKVGRLEAAEFQDARIIDASNHVLLPGMVNTHHHFYQTLTRNLPAVQNAKLFDWLVYLYEIWKGLDEDAIYWSSRLALAELLKTGCTLASDHHYLYPRSLDADIPTIQFGAARELGIRVCLTRGSMSRSKKDGGLPPDSTVQDEDTILAHMEESIRKFHDPAPDSMHRLALAPCSPFSVSEASMRAAAELGRRYAVRLHTHLAETADEDEYCLAMYHRRPLQVMEDTGFIGNDVWYAHGIFFTDDELKSLARTGTGIAHCPSSNMRLGSGICRVREMLDLGIPVSLGVDGSASNDSSDMIAEVRQALLLQRVRYGSGALTAREALAMATQGGARVLGFEDAGKIEAGALADLALFPVNRLDYAGALSDPVAALVFCGIRHEADYVMVNGRLVVEGGRLLTIDEDLLRDKANEASRRLLLKAGI
jgi:cytosine/adenosine deaminase-related metal-dependent hydrolase